MLGLPPQGLLTHPNLLACAASCATGSSKETLRPYVAFHAALRSAHQAFLAKLEESTRTALRQTLDSATSEFAVNLLASLPDLYHEEEEDGGMDGAGALEGGEGEEAGGARGVSQGLEWPGRIAGQIVAACLSATNGLKAAGFIFLGAIAFSLLWFMGGVSLSGACGLFTLAEGCLRVCMPAPRTRRS